jgi:hypothetical protein
MASAPMPAATTLPFDRDGGCFAGSSVTGCVDVGGTFAAVGGWNPPAGGPLGPGLGGGVSPLWGGCHPPLLTLFS